jgi:hypothetical protein
MQEGLHHDGSAYIYPKRKGYKPRQDECNFTGLVTGHAYAIVDAFTLSANGFNYRLIRIKNPWGGYQENKEIEDTIGGKLGEWHGKWSDGSDIYLKNVDKINDKLRELHGKEADLAPTEDEINEDLANDGTFFMEFEDFFNIWTEVQMVRKFENRFSGRRFKSEFNKYNNGGQNHPEKNPTYFIKIDRSDNKQTEMFIQLSSEDLRIKKGYKEKKMQFDGMFVYIYKMTNRGAQFFTQSDWVGIRDNGVSFFAENGTYKVVLYEGKAASGSQPDDVVKYALSIYFDCEKEEIETNRDDNQVRSEEWREIKEEEEVIDIDPSLREMLMIRAAAGTDE